MKLSLRTRLAVGSTVLFGLLVGGVSVVTYRMLVAQLDADAGLRVSALAQGLHGYLRISGDAVTTAVAADDDEQAAFVREATEYFQIYDLSTGRLLTESPGLAALGLQLSAAEVATFAARPATFDVATEFGRFRIATSLGAAPPGRGYLLQVGLSLDPLDTTLTRYRALLWWRVPALLAAAGLAFWWFAGLALRPLSQVAAATDAVDIANLGARLPVAGTGDELDLVASAFNRTLVRLEQSVGDMRQFSSALAHELRTPLAGLRGQVELALRTPGLAPAQRDLFARQIDEVDRLTRLISHILTLARAESGEIRLQRTHVDLGQLVADTVVQLELVAEAQGLDLRIEREGPAVVVEGDPGWLERVVLNLVDNALKYSTAGGHVVVRVGREGRLGRLTVIDTGVGLSSEDAARVFDRFFRADQSRPASSDGAGLGLSLVRWVVAAHGGTVSVASTAGVGSTFTVTLPIAGTSASAGGRGGVATG